MRIDLSHLGDSKGCRRFIFFLWSETVEPVINALNLQLARVSAGK